MRKSELSEVVTRACGLPFFMVVSASLLCSCGKDSEGKPRKPADTPAPVSPSRPSSPHLTVRIRPPFSSMLASSSGEPKQSDVSPSAPVVAWLSPEGSTVGDVLEFEPPRTIPGFHWSWDPGDPPGAFTLSAEAPSVWSPLKAGDLEQPEVGQGVGVGFALDLTQPPLARRWPAVVGGGNSEAVVLTLAGLSAVRPRDFGRPLRLEVDVGQDDSALGGVVLLAQAPSCGPLCVEFENVAHALDTPFVIARAASLFVDAPDGYGAPEWSPADTGTALRMVGLYASPNASSGVVTEAERAKESARVLAECAGQWQNLARFGRSLKAALSAQWSPPPGFSRGYDVYILQGPSGPQYQGLEHAQSTLLKLSRDCVDDDYAEVAEGLLAHEMVHVWNVRHLIPTEHASLDGGAFDVNRIRQLYFYEGFTEGFSRVVHAEIVRDRDLRTSWNQSLAALYAEMEADPSRAEVRLDGADPQDAFRQYQTGAGLLLLVALHLRSVHPEEEARSLFWSVLEKLRARVDLPGGISSFSSPIWNRRVWDGVRGTVDTTAGHSPGYATADVTAVLRGLTEDHVLASDGTAEAGAVIVRRSAVEEVLRAYAAATGFALETYSNGRVQLGTAGDRSWPF